MIKMLVEGEGDLLSLPILIKRTKTVQSNIQYVDMAGKSNIVRLNDGFEKTISMQIELGYTKFYILLDADVFFSPYENYNEEVQGMADRVNQFKLDHRVEIKLFWAIRAYESWLIGGLRKGDHFCELSKTIRGIPGDTEASPIDPKKWIKDHLSDGRYNPNVQVCLTRHFNITLARKRNNSFRAFLNKD